MRIVLVDKYVQPSVGFLDDFNPILYRLLRCDVHGQSTQAISRLPLLIDHWANSRNKVTFSSHSFCSSFVQFFLAPSGDIHLRAIRCKSFCHDKPTATRNCSVFERNGRRVLTCLFLLQSLEPRVQRGFQCEKD